ncbi:MAG: efflux RND transporter periplasmic adaptor subunit [Candidatus Marsarchaeota archaeon]|nr:efflux RND transporter periplasmic adaptor subunit [Candidatus Marsarchaeota archaeon]
MSLGLPAPSGSAEAVASHPGVPVKAIRVAFQNDASGSIAGMGSIQCSQMLDVGFETTGVLSKLLVKQGDRIAQGQILAELDNSVLDAEAAVKESEIKAAVAQLKYRAEEYAKREELFKKSAVSDSELKKSRYEMEKAQADLETAKAQQESISAKKDQRILRSPVSGVVAKRYVETGAVVTPGVHRVLRLLQCEEAIALLELGEKAYHYIRPGQRVVIQVDALGGREFVTKVNRICPEIDKKNRTFTIEAKIDNPDVVLAAGMFCRASIEPRHYSEKSLWIPKSALLPRQGASETVYIVKDGVAVSRKVQTGTEAADRVQILGGLKEGEILIVDGQKNISDLTEVSVSFIKVE